MTDPTMPTELNTPDADPAIAQRVAAGDVEAFAVLVRRYARPLSAYIAGRIGDRHTADDLTQDVFLRAYRSLSRGAFAGAASLKTWLFTIANNAVIDHHRHRARRPKTTSQKPAHDRADAASDPAHLTEQAEQAERARRLIAKLPDAQQQVITMKLLGQLSFAEIAEVLGCPVATARSRMRYGLMKIHEQLMTDTEQEVAR